MPDLEVHKRKKAVSPRSADDAEMPIVGAVHRDKFACPEESF